MKPEIKKRIAVSYIVIGLLLLFNNFLLPRINKKTLSFDVFSSEFFNAGEEKSITDGNAGFLAFGPYLGADHGLFQAEVFYTADSSGNTVEIYSGEYQREYSKLELPEGQHSVMLKADLPVDLSDTEIRVYYGGNGTLKLDKVIISERINDLGNIVMIYDIVLAAAGTAITVYAIKKKGKRT